MANTKVTSRVLANDAVLTANITDANITTAKIADNAVTGDKVADDVALAGNPTTTTQTAGNNTTRIATTAFVTTAVANIVDSAPSALDTLNELAAALGDDANFSTTITNSIAGKVALSGAGQTIADSGNLTLDVAGDIILDADGGDITFKDGGTSVGAFDLTSGFAIKSTASDADFFIQGNDGGSAINAVQFDMSDAGSATFNSHITINNTGADRKFAINRTGGKTFSIEHDTSGFSLYNVTDSSLHTRFTNTGRVGIGTVSPQAHLDINTETAEATTVILNGETNQDKILKFRHYANSEAAGDGYAGFIGSVVDNVLTLGHYNSSNTEVQTLHVTEGGKVGIGTASPASALHISGGDNTAAKLTFTNTANTNTYSIHAQNNSQTLNFQEDGTTVMSLATGGQVTATAGAASAPTYSFIGDTNTGMSRPTSDAINFVTDGTERIRVDSSGKVGIAYTSPSNMSLSQLTVGGGSGDAGISLFSGTSSISRLMFADGTSGGAEYDGFLAYNHTNQDLQFGTAGSGGSKLTLTSAGHLGIVSTARFYLDSIGDTYMSEYSANEFEIQTGGARRFALSGGNAYFSGSVTENHNFSDERLKENIVVIPNALEKVTSLRGITFTRKSDKSVGTGLIAQELEKVLPEAVFTSKTIDSLENPDAEEYKGIRYETTVGLLVEAIKELEERIKILEG